jgi:GNAT superfamily N-acetyltransferase
MHGQLSALGCTRRETPAMASTVAALPMEEPLPPWAAHHPRRRRRVLEAMQITALGQDFAPRATTKRMFGLGPQGPIRHLLGWIGDQPVAAATVMCLGESASLWGIATLPDFRGRGIGRAMTLAACRWARGRGQALIRLYATRMGLPVYSRLGFRPRGSLGLYLAPPETLGRKERRPAGDARRPIGTRSAPAPWGGGIPQGTGTVIYRGVVRR